MKVELTNDGPVTLNLDFDPPEQKKKKKNENNTNNNIKVTKNSNNNNKNNNKEESKKSEFPNYNFEPVLFSILFYLSRCNIQRRISL